MPKTKILQKDSPLLRKKALPVLEKDIPSKKIKSIVERMRRAMHAEEDGVAIAAPQIGESLRIFVVSGRAQAIMDKKDSDNIDGTKYKDLVFINPEITKLSRKKKEMEEGCLSVRWLYGKVKRHERASIKAWDENGNKIERGAGGLLAQIFQHEIDHLDGVLFIDKATGLEDLPPHKHHE